MDINELKIIKAVADAGSFSGAAADLNYVQSHISTQVLHLEQEIGAPIFERHPRGVTLTQKGELFLKYANEMDRILSEANRMITDGDMPGGTLRIASMQTTAQAFLPRVLSGYHKQYPGVTLALKTGTSAKNIRAVLNYEADVAFAAEKPSRKDLACVPLHKEHLVLLSAVSSVRKKEPANLAEETMLLFPAGCAYRARLESYLAVSHIVPKDTIEFDSLPAILASVCAGLGMTLLPFEIAKPHLKEKYLAVQEIPEKFSELPLYLIYRAGQYHSSSLDALIKLCSS